MAWPMNSLSLTVSKLNSLFASIPDNVCRLFSENLPRLHKKAQNFCRLQTSQKLFQFPLEDFFSPKINQTFCLLQSNRKLFQLPLSMFSLSRCFVSHSPWRRIMRWCHWYGCSPCSLHCLRESNERSDRQRNLGLWVCMECTSKGFIILPFQTTNPIVIRFCFGARGLETNAYPHRNSEFIVYRQSSSCWGWFLFATAGEIFMVDRRGEMSWQWIDRDVCRGACSEWALPLAKWLRRPSYLRKISCWMKHYQHRYS